MITDTVSGSPDGSDRQVAVRRVRLTARAVGRRFTREGPLVVLAGLALALVFNWPIVLHPKSTVMNGIGDPLLQAWQLAWNRQFVTGGDYWTANMFYPATDSTAFTDTLLGYLPLGLFGDGQYAAIFRYNIAFIFAFTLAFVGCYLLTRQLGGTWQAAAVAGVVFAWSPWRLDHNGHLNILSVGGIALALFALARGHGYSFRFGLRPELARPGWAFAGWVIAAWQVTIGFATGLPFVYVMGLVGLAIAVANVVRRRQLGIRVAVANSAGMVIFLGITYLMTIPYRRVVAEYDFVRPVQEISTYSPPWRGLLTANSQNWLWKGTFLNNYEWLGANTGEKLLFPGLVVLLLALLGLVVSAWPVRVRAWLAVTTAAVAILSLGTTFFGGKYTYLVLWEYLPGWDAMRTPGRLIFWAILTLALLAAGAVTRLVQIVADRGIGPRLAAVVLALPVIAVLVENVPNQTYDTVPGIPADLRQMFAQSRDPVLILPMEVHRQEPTHLLWSTEGFPPIANGYSTNFPPQYNQIARTVKSFPDNYSIAVLERYGIRKVALVKATAPSSPFADLLTRPIDGLPVTKTELDDIVVFTLR